MKTNKIYLSQLFLAFLLSIFTLPFTELSAQGSDQESLAFEYYQSGAYDKAADLLRDLFKKEPSSTVYYNYLYNALIQIKEFDEVEKMVKKTMKNFPERYGAVVDLGMVYQKQGDLKKAEKVFDDAVEDLKPDKSQILQLANAFSRYGKWDYVVKSFEKGKAILNDKGVFNMELAAAHESNRDSKKAIPYYLEYVELRPDARQMIESKFLPQLESAEYAEELKNSLLQNIQKSNSSMVFSELLIWYYSQFGKFKAAFIQAKALDKRFNESGQRIIDLARAARNQSDYDAAIDCYEYIMSKGASSRYYLVARQEILEVRQEEIANTEYTQEDLQALDEDYDEFLNEFGLNRNTAKTLREKAKLHAFYMDDYQGAISMLEDLIANPQVDNKLVAECKLDLGDFYLMNEEVWEATLLYSQVDKAMKDEPLGELARYKNAELSYYIGDFGWAQTQLSVLKGATSELISNNAIDLSVFIMDNMGLDTVAQPMEFFSKAELLSYQKKHDKAMNLLDSITYFYPEHNLKDNILYKKAEISEKTRDFSAAKDYYEKLLELNDPENLLLDNALFNLAKLYEEQFSQPQEAMDLYQKIILEFRESIFLIEARKRFRKLRGDQL